MADARQEIEIKLGGKTYRVRPDFLPLANVEAATGQPCQQLGFKMMSVSGIGIVEMATILFTLLRDCPDPPASQQFVGETIFEDGFQDYLGPLSAFFISSLKGHKEHVKEAAARAAREAAKPKEEAGADARTDPQTG